MNPNEAYKVKVYSGLNFVGYLIHENKEHRIFNYNNAFDTATKLSKESSFGVWFELEKTGGFIAEFEGYKAIETSEGYVTI